MGLFNGLCNTLEGVAGLFGGIEHLVDFGGGDILTVDATNAFAVQMDFEHDLGGTFAVFTEKLLQNHHHELHRGEIVVEHQHLEHLRRFGPLGASF